MRLLALSTAFTSYPEVWRRVRESSARCGLDLRVIGPGREYPWMQVFVELLREIRTARPEYVLYTDAYDTFVQRWDEEEVIQRIDAEPSGLLISCNEECWPRGEWCEAYPENGTTWRTACGGQFAGRADRIEWLMGEWLSGRWSAEAGGGNQEMMHRMKAAGVEFGLDSKCEVFQIMMYRSQAATEVRDGKVWNKVTGACPMILHFAGRVKGIQEYYGKIWPEGACTRA